MAFHTTKPKQDVLSWPGCVSTIVSGIVDSVKISKLAPFGWGSGGHDSVKRAKKYLKKGSQLRHPPR